MAIRFPDRLARLNRVFTNHLMAPVARHAPILGVLHHVGRRSGTAYTAPVLVAVSHEIVVIPLMYGLDRDWVRNVEQAGRFALEFRGRELACDGPEIVTDPAALPALGAFWGTFHARVPIDGYLVASRSR
ncbi:MAG TPA: nitroreductase family deazaflavin-dependent oxidoreductase [Marmoricola sp.]|jgi:deazaflavin-dependent oxidoreductase (nitroreductase family)|nr:nitroreductase family deazaflavin-dependent oxidoreductase [Marmoricola sp.]